MAIKVAITPNPDAKLFLADRPLMPGHDHLELTPEGAVEAGTPPVCVELVRRPDVRRVFVMHNFVTIVKSSVATWAATEPQVRELLSTRLSDFPIVEPAAMQGVGSSEKGIREVIDSYVAPAIAVDGGAIRFHSFDQETGVLSVDVLGSCHGCPSLINTLKRGIKPMLTDLFPEVTDVVRHIE